MNHHRKRAPRRAVDLPGRMRGGESWRDARILNVSRTGVMAECPDPPQRGTYIEIRRRRHVLIGIVVWSRGGRFGVALSDKLDIDALVAGAMPDANRERRDLASRPRRARRLVLTTPGDWRWLGKTVERLCITFSAAALVVATALLAYDVLATPLDAVASELRD